MRGRIRGRFLDGLVGGDLDRKLTVTFDSAASGFGSRRNSSMGTASTLPQLQRGSSSLTLSDLRWAHLLRLDQHGRGYRLAALMAMTRASPSRSTTSASLLGSCRKFRLRPGAGTRLPRLAQRRTAGICRPAASFPLARNLRRSLWPPAVLRAGFTIDGRLPAAYNNALN